MRPMTSNSDFKVTELRVTTNSLDVLCAQLTRDLFAIAKFLVVFHSVLFSYLSADFMANKVVCITFFP